MYRITQWLLILVFFGTINDVAGQEVKQKIVKNVNGKQFLQTNAKARGGEWGVQQCIRSDNGEPSQTAWAAYTPKRRQLLGYQFMVDGGSGGHFVGLVPVRDEVFLVTTGAVFRCDVETDSFTVWKKGPFWESSTEALSACYGSYVTVTDGGDLDFLGLLSLETGDFSPYTGTPVYTITSGRLTGSVLKLEALTRPDYSHVPPRQDRLDLSFSLDTQVFKGEDIVAINVPFGTIFPYSLVRTNYFQGIFLQTRSGSWEKIPCSIDLMIGQEVSSWEVVRDQLIIRLTKVKEYNADTVVYNLSSREWQNDKLVRR